jgi:lactate racemase
MQHTLDYGRTGLIINTPDDCTTYVLGLTPAPALADPQVAMQIALANPIGAPHLATLAQGKRDACIVLCDITRPVPNALILEAMLPEIVSAGIPIEKITLLIATGTHRPNDEKELREMLGDWVYESGVRIINHACEDATMLRLVGNSPAGIPVYLNTHWLDADLKITAGLIEPHFMAGYSGGRKLVMPGVAGLSTIQQWHSPRFLEHPNARNGVLDGNPVHEENTAIAAMAPADFICDVTIDEERHVTGIFAGHWQDAWRRGTEFVASQVMASVPELVDIAITSAGGYPLDQTFYQVVKGIVGAFPIVKPGGAVIIAGHMGEGIGGPHFRRALSLYDNLQDLVDAMSQPDWEYIPEQWQAEELAKAVREHRIYVVTDSISRAELAACHVIPSKSVEEALELERERVGQGKSLTLAVIPKGPYVIPHARTI